MKSSQNPWDILGKRVIDPTAADNILIAWPVILKLILKYFPESKNIKALDFGCGTGAFCTKIDQMGYSTTGIDPSVEMIKVAKANSFKSIRYILGDKSKLPDKYKFQIITSIMALPFIEDLEETIHSLTDHLKPKGIMIFADFNREWVNECLKKNQVFSDGYINFGDIKVKTYIRNAKDYEKIAGKFKLKKIIEEYPPFTQNFIENYPDKRPKNIPEYMILGYKKN